MKTHKHFFSIRVFFHGHWRLTGQQEKGGDHLLFHSTTSIRSRIFRHLFATLHGVDYHIFLITPLVFTRLLLNEIYHLIKLPFDWLMIWHYDFVCLRDDLILALLLQQCETGGFELALTITLVLQANRLTKCASYPSLLSAL